MGKTRKDGTPIKTSQDYYSTTAYSPRCRYRWDTTEVNILTTFRDMGVSFYDIGQILERSEASCYIKYARLTGRRKD